MQACRDRVAQLPPEGGSNAGLLLAHYLREADDGRSADAKKQFLNARDKLIRSVVGAPMALGQVYKLAFKRWEAAAEALGPSASAVFKTLGRTVIGLGEDSPLETGLHLHHTYGVPMIPGTALKGLASHYCASVWGEQDNGFKRGGAYHQAMFGDTGSAGHLVFPDAWILPEDVGKALQPDVITVHHPDYYQSFDGGNGPTDFDGPTPIPFVSVVGRFKVMVACGVAGDAGKAWADLGLKLLEEAFEQWGVGGKTSSGYGRLRRSSTEAVAEVAKGSAAGAAPAPDARRPDYRPPETRSPLVTQDSPLEVFKNWFDSQGFKSKGTHAMIMEMMKRLEESPDAWQEAAFHVLRKLQKPKDTIDSLWAYLHNPPGRG